MAVRLKLQVAVVSVIAAAVAAGPAAARLAPAHRPLDAAPDSTVSVNWAGFWVTPFRAVKPTRGPFTRVSGTWVQPASTCTALRPTSASFWVGIGGVALKSRALEQLGSAVDCDDNGTARHYLWWEIWPGPPHELGVLVQPGDIVSASVTIVKKKVVLRIANVTRATAYARTVKMKAPDRSSAEWITEAPADCNFIGICKVRSLTNFGTLSFTSASARSNAHVGPISDAVWHTTHADLVPTSASDGFVIPAADSGSAATSNLNDDGMSFSVAWQPPPQPQP